MLSNTLPGTPSWYFYLCHKDAVSHNKQIGCNFKSWFLKILCGLWPTPIVLLPVAPARNLCSDQKTHWWQSLQFPRMSKTTLEMLQLFSLSLQTNIHLMNLQKGTVLWKKMLKQVVLAEGLAKSCMVPNVCHMMPAGLTGGEGQAGSPSLPASCCRILAPLPSLWGGHEISLGGWNRLGGWTTLPVPGDSGKLRPWAIPPAVGDCEATRKEPLETSHGHSFPHVVII